MPNQLIINLLDNVYFYVSVNFKRYPGKFFVLNPRGLGFPKTLNFNKFYTFSPYSRPQPLIYSLNIYKFIEITLIFQ